ncbi:hypothetical protein ACQP26_19985 [Micromonospora sp. CA-248089]
MVRHAMPVVDPAVPAERWQLGLAGRVGAARLESLFSCHVVDLVAVL